MLPLIEGYTISIAHCGTLLIRRLPRSEALLPRPYPFRYGCNLCPGEEHAASLLEKRGQQSTLKT